MAGMTGWAAVDADAARSDPQTRFAGGVRFFCFGAFGFGLAFAALTALAARSLPVTFWPTLFLGVLAVGNILVAWGLSRRAGWGQRFGISWNMMVALLWLLFIPPLIGVGTEVMSPIVLGAGLVFTILFHTAAAIYLSYGRRPNLRFSARVSDPRYWGPHWVSVSDAEAVSHPQGRFGGKLWLVFGLVFLSVVGEAVGWWLFSGVGRALAVILQLVLLLFLVFRFTLAWPLTVIWAAMSFLRGVVLAGFAQFNDDGFWPMLLVGISSAIASAWVMIYFGEAARPNLVYRRRYRTVTEGEAF